MKRLLIIPVLIIAVFTLNCLAQANSANGEKVKSCKYLSFAEAEKILGQKVELVTNSWNSGNGKDIYDCVYQAVETDEANGRNTRLFFKLEQSSGENQAKEIYETIWKSNKDHAGIEVSDGIGDEAYFHSGKANFHFALIRKGKFTIRLKVNRASEKILPEDFKAFAKKVSERI